MPFRGWRDVRISGFGFLSDFGLRISDLLPVVAALMSLAATSHAGNLAGEPANSKASAQAPPRFYLGADISGLPLIEEAGGVYLDGDKPGDPIAIFMKHGWTCFRLRIWVDPRNGVNGLDYTTKLARRIKAAGASFMLDFHYSDWWADPQKQNKPAAWAKLDFDALVDQVQSYTSNVVAKLKDAGVTPDFVQIGNEITGGLLWPDAQVKVPLSTIKVFSGEVQPIAPPQPYDDVIQWSHLVRILKAASAGVRSATTTADQVRIIVHIDCGGDWPVTKWYFDHLSENHVDYDIIGQSYYPDYHGTLENLRDNFKETINRFHKDVMVVETAYDSRGPMRTDRAAKNMVWQLTPDGQRQFLADVIQTVKEAPDGRGIGVNYWAPEGTYITNAVAAGRRRGPGPRSLFDNQGHPLPAMYLMDGPSPPATTPGAGTTNATAAPRRPPWGGRQKSFGPTTPFGSNGIELEPFVIDHRYASNSVVDLSFLLDAPAGKDGFLRVKNENIVKGNGKPIRFWGFNITEWSRGSTEIPVKDDAPIWASALARLGVNIVRLQFLDLPAPRGLIDGTRDDSQHFDAAQLDNEDFFLAELIKRGIYVDFNLNVGRQFKEDDGVLALREGKGPLLFDKRLIELERDYARQLLTHVNPYTKRAYVDEPGIAIVEIVNEDAIGVGWSSGNAYDRELTDLFNKWLSKNVSAGKVADFRALAGVGPDQPVPRLKGRAMREAPRERYYTECKFFSDLESGFFKEMSSYLRNTLKVKCPLIATADHSHSGSGYPLETDAQQLDIMDGHDYWRHPSVPPYRHSPMVNEPFNGTLVELSRTAMAGKPFTVSEVNHPWPNQFACEGIPILAAYGDFQNWNAIMWYTFEPKRDPGWRPVLTEPFDMSHDPVKVPEMAAGALMFLRHDLDSARKTVERSYSTEEVWDSRLLDGTNRPYFTPGFPGCTSLLHGSRIRSLKGKSLTPAAAQAASPYQSDTGQLTWFADSTGQGLVAIDSPRSQGLVGFLKASCKSASNLAVEVSNNFCAITLNSLDSKPISRTSRILLITASRVENSGMTWNSERTVPANWGSAPTVIEPVIGKVILKNLLGARQVWANALDGSGQRLDRPRPAHKDASGWVIVVGHPVSPWYEITVDR